MKNPKRFYTYAYLRENGTPYYIGKGCARRIYVRNRRHIKPPEDKSRVIFLKKNLTEDEAFKHEIYMIDIFGRKDLGTGILLNMSDGGQGSSGYKHTKKAINKISKTSKGRVLSEETKKKISDSHKGKKGHKLSEEHKLKISSALKGRVPHNKGISPSLEVRKKISESIKGKIVSDETRKKISKIHKGKKLSEEQKERLREVNTGKKMSEETKRKLSLINTGKNHPQYGKPKSEETIRKMIETKKKKAKEKKINNSSK